MVERVTATVEALEFIDYLKKKHNSPLMFYQSGGCCDNTAPTACCQAKSPFQETTRFLEKSADAPFTSASRTTSSISTPR